MSLDRELPIDELTAQFRSERAKLDTLQAPRIREIRGSDADEAFQIESGVRYALDYVDVLLNRIAALEERMAQLES